MKPGLSKVVPRLLGWGLAALGAGAGLRAGEPLPPLLPDVVPRQLNRQAAVAATAPFAVQAANGAVLEQTLWAHHFLFDRPEELHYTGFNLLDRVARRHIEEGRGGCLRLYLQRTNLRGPVGELAAKRGAVDEKRVQLVSRYLAAAWPDVAFTISVYDQRTPGMSAVEASQAQVNHRNTSLGFIPPDFRAVLSSSAGSSGATGPGGQPSSGGLLIPQTVAQPGTGGPSALGASAGVDSGPGSSPP